MKMKEEYQNEFQM